MARFSTSAQEYLLECLKRSERFHRICEVLGIVPYDEVRDYVLKDEDKILFGRRMNGKTTAVLLDALVRERVPASFPDCSIHSIFWSDPDFYLARYPRVMRWYKNELQNAVAKCEAARINVREGQA